MTLSLSAPIGLAYCRHLSTVRTHLSALVNHRIVSADLPCDAGRGLTAGIWEQYLRDSSVRLGPGSLWRDRDAAGGGGLSSEEQTHLLVGT